MSKRSEKKKDALVVAEVVESGLSRRHEGVVVALLANPTIAAAAKAAGVSEATVWRLMQREDFQTKYREAQETALNGALGTLQGASSAAIAALQKNLTCGVPAAENAAAKTILDFTFKVREQFDLENRIKQLEAHIKATEEAKRLRGAREDEEEDEAE